MANRHTDTYNGYQSRVLLWRLQSKAKANHSRQTNNYTAFAPMCATMATFLMNFLLKSATRNTSRRRSLSAECIIVCACFLSATGRASAGATDRFSVLGIVCDLWSHYLPLLISNWAGPADQITDSPCVSALSLSLLAVTPPIFVLQNTHNLKVMCKLLITFLENFLLAEYSWWSLQVF